MQIREGGILLAENFSNDGRKRQSAHLNDVALGVATSRTQAIFVAVEFVHRIEIRIADANNDDRQRKRGGLRRRIRRNQFGEVSRSCEL